MPKPLKPVKLAKPSPSDSWWLPWESGPREVQARFDAEIATEIEKLELSPFDIWNRAARCTTVIRVRANTLENVILVWTTLGRDGRAPYLYSAEVACTGTVSDSHACRNSNPHRVRVFLLDEDNQPPARARAIFRDRASPSYSSYLIARERGEVPNLPHQLSPPTEAQREERRDEARRRNLAAFGVQWFSESQQHPSYHPNVAEWWNHSHDSLLRELAKAHGWRAPEFLLQSLPEKPNFQGPSNAPWGAPDYFTRHAWFRFYDLALDQTLPPRLPNDCKICGKSYWNDTCGDLTISSVSACPTCIGHAIYGSFGRGDLSRDEIAQFIRDICSAIERVPPSTFIADPDESADFALLTGLPESKVIDAIRVLHRRPSRTAIITAFGSWFHGLVESGVLAGATQRGRFGIKCLAEDGHVCLSLGEKMIDDWLLRHGISHEREVRYGPFRADFVVGRTYVEYLGLAGNEAYDAKTERKKSYAVAHGSSFLFLLPENIATTESLDIALANFIAQSTA